MTSSSSEERRRGAADDDHDHDRHDHEDNDRGGGDHGGDEDARPERGASLCRHSKRQRSGSDDDPRHFDGTEAMDGDGVGGVGVGIDDEESSRPGGGGPSSTTNDDARPPPPFLRCHLSMLRSLYQYEGSDDEKDDDEGSVDFWDTVEEFLRENGRIVRLWRDASDAKGAYLAALSSASAKKLDDDDRGGGGGAMADPSQRTPLHSSSSSSSRSAARMTSPVPPMAPSSAAKRRRLLRGTFRSPLPAADLHEVRSNGNNHDGLAVFDSWSLVVGVLGRRRVQSARVARQASEPFLRLDSTDTTAGRCGGGKCCLEVQVESHLKCLSRSLDRAMRERNVRARDSTMLGCGGGDDDDELLDDTAEGGRGGFFNFGSTATIAAGKQDGDEVMAILTNKMYLWRRLLDHLRAVPNAAAAGGAGP